MMDGKEEAAYDLSEGTRLYGRKKEAARLREAYHRRRCHRTKTAPSPELVLITGISGTGKTTLARSLGKTVSEDGGFFVSGKFDQMQGHEPYGPFVTAFTEFCSLLVARGEETLHEIQECVRESTDIDAMLLTETVPALEEILGTERGSSNSQTSNKDMQKRRFLAAFRGLVRAVSSSQRPLILFLDDLQWADQGCLELLAVLAEDKANEGFMLLGACRGNEVSLDDPLSVTLRALEDEGVVITNIELLNFTRSDIRSVISMLFPTTDNFDDLCDALFEETDGNIFFLLQLTKRLEEEGILTLDEEQKQWHLVKFSASTNFRKRSVSVAMASVMKDLPDDIQQVLMTASCLGNTFRENHLCVVLPKLDIRAALMFLRSRGVIFYDGDTRTGRFAHDRLQEAAFSLISTEMLAMFRFSIGLKLLEGLSEREVDRNIFLIIDQVASGKELISSSGERNRLSVLCLRAGQKAMSSSAFSAAAHYLDLGIGFLGPQHWRNEYELSLALFNAAAEAGYCSARFDRTDFLVDQIVRNARSFDDKIQAYTTLVFALGAQERFPEAIRIGFDVLRELGEPFPAHPRRVRILVEVMKTKWMLRKFKSVEAILDLPVMSDPNKLAALRMLNLIYLYVFFTDQDFVPLVAARVVRRTLEYGLSGMGSSGFSTFGMLLSGIFGQIDEGYRYCQVALRMLERFDERFWMARVYVPVYGMVNHWKEPIRNNLEPLKKAYQVGCQSGDVEFAMMSATIYSFSASHIGVPLPQLSEEMIGFAEEMKMYKQEAVLSLLLPMLQFFMNLMGKASGDPCVLTGEFMDQVDYLSRQYATGNATNVSVVRLLQLELCYYLDELDRATEFVKDSRTLARTAESTSGVFIQVYFEGLLAAGLGRRSRKRQYLKAARRCLKRTSRWAKHSPETFLSFSELLRAEVSVLEGDLDAALQTYKRSITLAEQERYIQVQALACHRAAAALLYFGKGGALEYLVKARSLYQEWGAEIMVQRMDEIIADG